MSKQSIYYDLRDDVDRTLFIKHRLEFAGIKLSEIAGELAVSGSLVSAVIRSRAVSAPTRRYIAQRLNMPVEQLWPMHDGVSFPIDRRDT